MSSDRPEQIIVTHANADFDAFGAMLAARRLYPQAVVCVQGGLNRNVREFASLHADELDLVEAARCDLSGVSRVIVVETSHLSRLGEVSRVIERPGVEVVLFDHHGEQAPDWVSPQRCVVSSDGALCSTMVGILAERGIEPTPTESTALALGIHEDTGSLTYPSTTLRDIEALAFCARHGASQEMVGTFLHTPLTEEQRALLTTLLDAASQVEVGGAAVLVCAVEWPRYVDAVSTLATKITDLTDCQALIMLVAMDDRVFVVGRSRTPALDVARALAEVGGGGHPQAASALVRGRPLAAVRAAVVEALEHGLVPAPRARDIMSAPAWFVSHEAQIETAIAECRRRHTSGVLVEADGLVTGVVARDDLGRAVAHGLTHAPVRAVMSAQVEAVAADATLAEVQRTLTRSPSGRVPVSERGGEGPHATADVLGVITRGDLLQALHEPPAADRGAAAGDLADRLRELPGLERLWTAVGEAAAGFEGVYLVGGAVRDLLLGEPSFDIDLAVEGDGVEFAGRLAKLLRGRVHAHDKFHTAVVIAGDLRVDVASARTEHYEYPAALPIVEHSSIRQDLFRRDFTINSMAVALHAQEFGVLYDPYGGLRDLRERVIRVLHNLSFIEDPTRIFRAVRYENRHGFAMDAHTRELARSCVDMGLVGDLSGARVRDELVAILSEQVIEHALGRLDELGLAAAVHPGLDAGPGARSAVAALDRVRMQHAPQLDAWRGRLAVLAARMPADELVAWLDRLRMRRRDARVIAAAVVVPPRLVERLEAAASPADVAELLAAHPLEVALVVAASAPPEARAAAELYLERLRDVRLDVDGAALRSELGIPESPRLGEILAELLRRKRNGELGGRDEQLAAARELAAGAHR